VHRIVADKMFALLARTRVTVGRILARMGLARFHSDERGVSLVEFGLVAVPFIALTFAILETALMFFAGQTLDTAVARSARLIRTGQAQQQGFDINKFRDDICDQILSLFSCDGNLKLSVKKFPTFADIDLDRPVDADGNLNVDETYDPGHGGDIVVVRAYYEWPTYVRLLGNNLSDMPDGNHLLVSTAAFRNEPFPW
jgi:Flp pilus assembly pilin Flp